MLTRARPPAAATTPGEWSRGRLVAALMLLLLIGLSLAGGVVLWVWLRFHPAAAATGDGGSASNPAAAGASGANGSPGSAGAAGSVGGGGSGDPVQARREVLAAAPMSKADLRAAQPSTLSVRDPGAIVLPASTAPGRSGSRPASRTPPRAP